jgi:superoxide reductase
MAMMVVDSGVNPDCCGIAMERLTSRTNEEGAEKHLPVIERLGDRARVRIGEVSHPMAAEHRVEWIALVDGKRVDIQRLGLNSDPVADFTIREGKEMLRAYAFCNIHGLWEAESW